MALDSNSGPLYSTDLSNGDLLDDDLDSTCSTPYVSAPSSPGRSGAGGGYFFSAPASPMHYITCSYADDSPVFSSHHVVVDSASFEFEFSSRYSPNGGGGGEGVTKTGSSMSSADELFLNGQIRPMKLSSHLQRPQLVDLDDDEEEGGDNMQKRGRDVKFRSRSLHRKTRSLSPLRNDSIQWHADEENKAEGGEENEEGHEANNSVLELEAETLPETTPPGSASSSRSSSSGRNSKKWIFLKDLLYRSKSEGRARANEKQREKFWTNISFHHIIKEKKLNNMSQEQKPSPSSAACASNNSDNNNNESHKRKKGGKQQLLGKKPAAPVAAGKPANGVAAKRRGRLSAHELHYTKNRAQAEEMKKRTFLPYRQGLLGCLGFSSKGYGALNGLTKTFNPVSSR